PTLPGMSDVELTAADIRATGSSPDTHPFQHVRDKLHALDVVPINRLPDVPDGRKVAVAGLVTHRQAPETAGGMLFVNLEDETGHANITVTPGLRAAHPAPAHTAPALLVVGRLHHTDGAPTVTAEKLTPLRPPGVIKSRDFQ
ncbi:MAG: OB-fold nucleic acid binding domain-containing protein, partial [Stackebrandtia sp.]